MQQTLRMSTPSRLFCFVASLALTCCSVSARLDGSPPTSHRSTPSLHDSAYDLDEEPNYTVHLIDASRMVETNRVCIPLDSPSVRLNQVANDFRFEATLLTDEARWYQLTSSLEFVSIDPPQLSAVSAHEYAHHGSADSPKVLGSLPGLGTTSVTALNADGTVIYYSTQDIAGTFSPVTSIVRYDRRTRQVSGRLTLAEPGCTRNVARAYCRIHYLFMDTHGTLLAVAGSAIERFPARD